MKVLVLLILVLVLALFLVGLALAFMPSSVLGSLWRKVSGPARGASSIDHGRDDPA